MNRLNVRIKADPNEVSRVEPPEEVPHEILKGFAV